jgi:hypothetical protein
MINRTAATYGVCMELVCASALAASPEENQSIPGDPVSDNPKLLLTITLDKKTHEVSVYAPGYLEKNQEMKRFFKVWSEVLRDVPSPSVEQKPD